MAERAAFARQLALQFQMGRERLGTDGSTRPLPNSYVKLPADGPRTRTLQPTYDENRDGLWRPPNSVRRVPPIVGATLIGMSSAAGKPAPHIRPHRVPLITDAGRIRERKEKMEEILRLKEDDDAGWRTPRWVMSTDLAKHIMSESAKIPEVGLKNNATTSMTFRAFGRERGVH